MPSGPVKWFNLTSDGGDDVPVGRAHEALVG